MYHYLNNLKKDCRIIHISELPSEYMFFNNDNVIETYDPQNHDTWISKSSTPIILYVGRLSFQKDIPTMLKTYKIIANEFDSKLLIVGDGPQRKLIEELISFNGSSQPISVFKERPFLMSAVS